MSCRILVMYIYARGVDCFDGVTSPPGAFEWEDKWAIGWAMVSWVTFSVLLITVHYDDTATADDANDDAAAADDADEAHTDDHINGLLSFHMSIL